MPRNRIEMSRRLFDRLLDHAEQQGAVPDRAARYIKRQSAEDAELMARATAQPLAVTRQVRIVRMEFRGDIFFAVFGLGEPETVPSGLELVDVTPGTFALAILEAGIRPGRNVTAAQVLDATGGAYLGNGDGYDGHDLDHVRALFPEMLLYRANAPLDYHNDDYRVLGALLARTYLDGPIALEPSTSARLSEAFEEGSPYIPYRNLVQGVLAISWEYFFVEAYRCVEQLYPAPKMLALREDISAGVSGRDFAKAIELHLGWYPREEDAFRLLLERCGEPLVMALMGGLSTGIRKSHRERCRLVARQLYNLRNRVVHYRPAHQTIEIDDGAWNSIVRDMLAAILFLYDRYGEQFFGY